MQRDKKRTDSSLLHFSVWPIFTQTKTQYTDNIFAFFGIPFSIYKSLLSENTDPNYEGTVFCV